MAYRVLEVTLLSAKDLKNVNLITRMEVYAVATISGDPLTRQCTLTDPYGGRHPSWNATLRFAVPPTASTASGCLHVLLRAERAFGDRDVGEVIVPLAEILSGAGAGDPGPRPQQFASYQVRKVHRTETRGVLDLTYRLGPVIAPQVPQAKAVDDPVVTYRPFHPPAYTLPPAPPPSAPPPLVSVNVSMPPPSQAAGRVAVLPSPQASGHVAKSPPPQAAGHVAVPRSPRAAGHVAKSPPPQDAGHVAVLRSPQAAGHVSMPPPPQAAGNVAVPRSPQAAGHVSMPPPPEAAGHVAVPPSPQAAGHVAKSPPPQAAGHVAVPPSPQAAGHVVKSPPPHVAGHVAVPPSPQAAGHVAVPPPPRAAGHVAVSPRTAKNNGNLDFGLGRGAGLVGGPTGGMLAGDMMSDAAAYGDTGNRVGLADGGGAEF